MSFPGYCGPGISSNIIIYFCLLHNQGGRFKIVSIIDHVLCVLLFMNGFMPSAPIAILILLGSMANSGFCESLFCHCVASAGCLIILASCICFSLCPRNNSNSLLANQCFKQGNDRKVRKHHFRPAFPSISIAVLVITTVLSTIESIELQIGHFSRSSYSGPQYRMQSFLHVWIFSTSKPKEQIIYFAS
jgi:hypothetical protein